MFKTILLAIDGSDYATKAAEAALGLVKELKDGDRKVVLFHVSDEAPSRSQVLKAELDVKSVLRQKAAEVVAPTAQRFEEVGVAHGVEVALGDPADEIVAYAGKNDVDLIVIGSRGLGAVSSVLMGSVSRRVMQEAKCPVMVVK